MRRSLERVLEERDRKIFLKGAELARGHGYPISWSIENIDEINDLISKDGFEIYVDFDSHPDAIVTLLRYGEEVGRGKVFVVGDRVYSD